MSNGQRGGSWSDLTNFVSGLAAGTMYRHNQSGDFFYDTDDQGRELINLAMLKQLVDANKASGAKGYTYSHHKLNTHNKEALKYANTNGFTVNASCETMSQADDVISAGVPAVCVVDNSQPVPARTPAGHKVVVCPAQTSDTDCKSCGLCAKNLDRRSCVVAFLSHGNGAKKVNRKLSTLVHNSKEAA